MFFLSDWRLLLHEGMSHAHVCVREMKRYKETY